MHKYKWCYLIILLAIPAHAAKWDAAQVPKITAKKEVPAPDYAKPESWAAYPGHAGIEEETPVGVQRKNGNRSTVDVFYIHPTTYLSVFHDNGRTDETGLASTVLKGVLRYQASVFNDCCRIFMPHYRQASIKRIIGTSDAAIKATDLAYSDVVNAFDYYMAHENHGRPFLLASHSQGSSHALRLLQERIIGTPLQTRMIAAYALGGTLPTAIKEKGLPICDSPTMAGCLIGWNTVDKGHEDSWRMKKSLIWWDGHYQPIAGRPRICVNPLNWKKDGAEEASENLGSAYDTGKDKPAVAIVAHATSAACKNGFLEIDLRSDQRSNYRDILSVFGNYHDFDYSVFYMNIRYNVALRIKAYFKSNPVN